MGFCGNSSQGCALGLLSGDENALVHLALNVSGPFLGIGLGVEGFAGDRMPFAPDSRFPLEVAALSDARHSPPPFLLTQSCCGKRILPCAASRATIVAWNEWSKIGAKNQDK
jgi:hypothetical protein